jgi:hypothetical protein
MKKKIDELHQEESKDEAKRNEKVKELEVA